MKGKKIAQTALFLLGILWMTTGMIEAKEPDFCCTCMVEQVAIEIVGPPKETIPFNQVACYAIRNKGVASHVKGEILIDPPSGISLKKNKVDWKWKGNTFWSINPLKTEEKVALCEGTSHSSLLEEGKLKIRTYAVQERNCPFFVKPKKLKDLRRYIWPSTDNLIRVVPGDQVTLSLKGMPSKGYLLLRSKSTMPEMLTCIRVTIQGENAYFDCTLKEVEEEKIVLKDKIKEITLWFPPWMDNRYALKKVQIEGCIQDDVYLQVPKKNSLQVKKSLPKTGDFKDDSSWKKVGKITLVLLLVMTILKKNGKKVGV